MRQINLYNSKGQLVTVVNIRETGDVVDAVMWGIRFFVWNGDLQLFQEANVSPAIIDSLN